MTEQPEQSDGNPRCYCAPVLDCGAATAEVDTTEEGDWLPVCERCMEISFEAGFLVRKLSPSGATHESRLP